MVAPMRETNRTVRATWRVLYGTYRYDTYTYTHTHPIGVSQGNPTGFPTGSP